MNLNIKNLYLIVYCFLPLSGFAGVNDPGFENDYRSSGYFAQFDSQLVVLEKTNLPLVIIDTKGQEIEDEPRIIAHMGIIDHGGNSPNLISDEYNVYNGRISIEIRGQSTQQFPKKSYALETQNGIGENLNIPLLGMPEENDWILYAPFSDKSLLRNVITFTLAREQDYYASRTLFCELVLNGDYQGIYVLMEKIKVDKNRVDIAKLRPEEISGDDLTGGYIFKVDKLDPDYLEGYSGWTSSPDPPYPDSKDIIYQYYDPKDDELVPEQKTYLKNQVSLAEKALISEDFADPDSGYNKYLNTGSFVDFLIINEIGKEFDKYRYSNFFYKNKDSKGGEIYAGPIWDFNLAYGNIDYWDGGVETSGWRYDDVVEHEKSIIFWWKRLMEDPYFEDMATTRWNDLRQDKFSDERIRFIIDSLLTYTNSASTRNYERWPILGSYVWPNYDWENNTYDDEVEFFTTWLFARLEWMDNNFNGRILEPSANLSGAVPTNMPGINSVEISLFDDYFDHSRLDTSDFILESSVNSVYISDVNYVNASKAVLYISSTEQVIPENTDISVTVDQKVLNGFSSVHSNSLKVGNSDYPDPGSGVKIYSADGIIFIRSTEPEHLPPTFEVYNKTGQKIHIFELEKSGINQVQTSLPPDIYLVRLFVKGMPVVKKVYVE